MAGISPARKAAFKILLAMARGEGHSDELLRADAVNALSSADRNLATSLVLGVLRWQSVLDAQIRMLLAKPNAKVDAEISLALRMGAYQLLHLDRIPAHAAISESVELAKQAGHKFAAGMVNAVLRNLAAEREERFSVGAQAPNISQNAMLFLDTARSNKQEIDNTRFRIESRAAYPAWMVERWVRLFGADAAYAICAYGQRQPRLAVRLMNARVEEELADAGVQLEPGALLTAARAVVAGDVTATEAFHAGRVRIQDEGSQLVGEIAAFSATNLNQNQKKILDACAAPGGKTLILAERLADAQIVACESSPMRHATLRARVAAYADRVECWLANAATLAEEESFDLVLVDAPCSGTGTLGRNPEIRHRLRVEDLARQAERQKAILHAALRAVKLGGRVVYSTCSLEPEENERVVADGAGKIVPVGACLEAMRREGILTESGARELAECVTGDGALRLMPGALGTDGFFVAVMEKR